MEKKKFLIVNFMQFGYHIGNLKYCQYLKDDFEISYICFDYKKERIIERGINIHYVSREGNIIVRNIRFIKYVYKTIKNYKFHFIYIQYFQGSSLLPLFLESKQKLHLDIRTGSVSANLFKREIYNFMLRIESFFFKSISIISVGLRNKLGISKKAYILPLGADPIFVKRKLDYKLHLLYIGILTNRHIEKTIYGTSLFLKEFPTANIYYTIVGDGWNNEKDILQNLINKLNLQSYFNLAGHVSSDKLLQFYTIANVGVSYIPMTKYFEYQPPTKTFEYLMAGIPVIATNTYENRQIINRSNGILINDKPEDFADAISQLYKSLNTFDEKIIRDSIKGNEWSHIIHEMKEVLLMKLF